MEHKVNIPWPLRIIFDKVLVPLRPLPPCIACKHALQTDAHAFNALYWRPALSVEEIETDNAVRVDMRMPGYWVLAVFQENYFGRLCGEG